MIQEIVIYCLPLMLSGNKQHIHNISNILYLFINQIFYDSFEVPSRKSSLSHLPDEIVVPRYSEQLDRYHRNYIIYLLLRRHQYIEYQYQYESINWQIFCQKSLNIHQQIPCYSLISQALIFKQVFLTQYEVFVRVVATFGKNSVEIDEYDFHVTSVLPLLAYL